MLLEAKIEGEGPTVVVLHGVPVPPESVEMVCRRLRTSYQVVVPDLFGVGLPADEALDALVETLQHHDICEASLVGHSFGAYRAFQLATSGRVAVRRVVALSPLAYYPEPVRQGYRELGDALEAGVLGPRELARSLAPQWFSEHALAQRPELAERLEGWFTELGRDGLIDVIRREIQSSDLRPALGRIQAPVYIRVGSLDQGTPVAWAREIAALLPVARLEVVEGAGHFLQYEDAEATLQAIEAFLQS